MNNNLCSISSVSVDPSQKSINLIFQDMPHISWKFHAQWLASACAEHGFSKSAANSPFMLDPRSISSAQISINGALTIAWENKTTSSFPSLWLRVFANVVALPSQPVPAIESKVIKYWYPSTDAIPEVDWSAMIDANKKEQIQNKVIDLITSDYEYGIVKIINLPELDMVSELKGENNLVTKILRDLFGSVYYHPRRGANKSSNVTTENNDKKKLLHNYNNDELLLPHTDHAFFTNPSMIAGLHQIEGASINTWLDGFAALRSLKKEDLESYHILCDSSLCYGRIAEHYSPHFILSSTHSPITFSLNQPNSVKWIRWHPHLIGWVNSSFDSYPKINHALQKFQKILLRPEIKLEIKFQPGDLYLWNNFRILHGRQEVLEKPRTASGQTVSEEVVRSKIHEIKIGQITSMDKKWLAQMPIYLLDEIIKLEHGTSP